MNIKVSNGRTQNLKILSFRPFFCSSQKEQTIGQIVLNGPFQTDEQEICPSFFFFFFKLKKNDIFISKLPRKIDENKNSTSMRILIPNYYLFMHQNFNQFEHAFYGKCRSTHHASACMSTWHFYLFLGFWRTVSISLNGPQKLI